MASSSVYHSSGRPPSRPPASSSGHGHAHGHGHSGPPPPYNSYGRTQQNQQQQQQQPPPPGSQGSQQQYPTPYASAPGSSGSGYGHYPSAAPHHSYPPPQRPHNYSRAPPSGSSSSYGSYPPPPAPASTAAPAPYNPASSSQQQQQQQPFQGRNSSWSSHSNAHQSSSAPPGHPQMKLGHRETEEERRERKKREYEMKKQRDARVSSSHHSQAVSVPPKQRIEKKPSSIPDKAENRLKRPCTFLCKIKFRNELPDPVSQPKLLRIYNDKDRYSKYSITSMEKTFKHKLFVEPDLGIPLDLLDLSVYNPKNKPPMDPADAELLVDDEIVVKQKTDSMRRRERPTDKGVAWLVKTTYISPVSMDPAKQSLTEKQAKELREQKEGRKENINDREQQIQAIEESFRVSKMQPVHLTKPELKPVEILPLLPDFDRAGDQFVHVVFDTEPTADAELYSKLDRSARDYIESRAIVKSYSLPKEDGKTEKFLAYMVPKMDEAHDDDDEIPYTWIREYHWDVRAEDARNNYVFCFGEDSVQYLPISSKLILRKKKAREGRSKDEVENQFLVPSSIAVRRRDLTDEEEYQRESLRRSFMEGHASLDEEPANSKRKRPVESERHSSSSKRRRAYEEETRDVSDDEDVSI